MSDLHLAKPPAQPQPTFPQTNVQITPQGLAVATILAPGVIITTMLNEETMNEVCRQWIASRKQIKRDVDLMAEVMRNKR